MKKFVVAILVMVMAFGTFILSACDDKSIELDGSIALDKTELTMYVGDEATLTPDIDGVEDVAITWSSSDESVVTVNDGKVKAIKAGNAKISASILDGKYTAECSVEVKNGAINLDKNNAIVKVGETLTLTATLNPENMQNKVVTWSSSDSNVATVENGVVTTLKEGEVTITATNNGVSASCVITVVAESAKFVNNIEELYAAINGQSDNDFIVINEGEYDVNPANITIELYNQKGWYFPIVKNNVTIIGNGNVELYSTSVTKNGVHSSQNFITVSGDNVTIIGLTLLGKLEANKTVEVYGKNFTIKDCVLNVNDKVSHDEYCKALGIEKDSADDMYMAFSGSLYFNSSKTSENNLENVIIENVILYKSYISTINAKNATISIKNSTLDVCGNKMMNYDGFNAMSANASQVFTNVENFTIVAGNGFASKLNEKVVKNAPDGTTVLLKEGTYFMDSQVRIERSITLKGEGRVVLTAGENDWVNETTMKGFAPIITVAGYEYAKAEKELNVVIDNIIVRDPQDIKMSNGGTDYGHGINVVEGANVTIKNCEVLNCAIGIVVNRSHVVVENTKTSGNTWGAINVYGTNPEGQLYGEASLTIDSASKLNDEVQIYADNDLTFVTVNAEGYTKQEADGVTVWTKA